MKRVVLALLILAVIIASGVLENVYITKTFDRLDEMLRDLESLIKEQNDSALESIRDINSWWEKKRTYIELFAYSPDVRAFSVALAETEGSLECGDFDNALSKCRSLIVMAQSIKRILDFNVEDII
ncbi:MAG: DUF4363 family protein [Christensenellales bacterium]